MRIPQGRRGCLAAVALAAFGAVQGDSNFYVSFNTGFNGSFGDPPRAMISSVGHRELSFGWTSQNVTVSEVRLFGFSNLNQKAFPVGCGMRVGEPNGQPSGSKACDESYRDDVESFQVSAQGRRDPQGRGDGDPGVSLTVVSNASGGKVTVLDVENIAAELLFFKAELLFFKAIWGDSDSSYSRFFAIAASAISDLRLSQSDPAKPESRTPTGSSSTAAPTTGTPSSDTKDGNSDQTVSTASAEPTRNSDGSLGGGGGLLTTPEGSPVNGNGGGLAQGAIIGIAVGCGVAGLLVICGLAWYLLRRRQQKKAMHAVDSPYGSGSRGEELMAEKEAGADVDVTPHSPYSDDGGAASGPGGPSGGAYPNAHGEAVAAGAVAAAAVPRHPHLQDPPQSFTPYSDRPSAAAAAAAAGTPSVRAASVAQTDEPRVRVPSPVPGRATPRGLTTPYAHLVEDGMTEDEIRRLEEEERQLDAAIEQAGRR